MKNSACVSTNALTLKTVIGVTMGALVLGSPKYV
jgi:hypothetical protein